MVDVTRTRAPPSLAGTVLNLRHHASTRMSKQGERQEGLAGSARPGVWGSVDAVHAAGFPEASPAGRWR